MTAPCLTDDTIAALASAAGAASRGIVRISGPETKRVVSQIFRPADENRWDEIRLPRRHVGMISLRDMHVPVPVDVLFWPTSRSYSGQPTAEMHMVGSPPLLEAVLQQLFSHGARPAQRGEFTLRAFLAGRIDLVQAEAVLGVIDASDQQQLRLALDQLGGGLSHRIATLHEELLLHLADLEAGLDFVEEDIEFVAREELNLRIEQGLAFLHELLSQADSRLQTSSRLKVVLAGLPNAGKSTLLNALVGNDAAIVSSIAGTTRDYLSVPLDQNGISLDLIDTAGWESLIADDSPLSIQRAADESREHQWERADLVLWCTAADWDDDAVVQDAKLREQLVQQNRPLLPVVTKSDLVEGESRIRGFLVSAATGDGLGEFKEAVISRMRQLTGDERILGTTAARCRNSLSLAREALERARQAAIVGAGDELIAVELREALEGLGEIAGRVYTDDILDRVFSRFCIGK